MTQCHCVFQNGLARQVDKLSVTTSCETRTQWYVSLPSPSRERPRRSPSTQLGGADGREAHQHSRAATSTVSSVLPFASCKTPDRVSSVAASPPQKSGILARGTSSSNSAVRSLEDDRNTTESYVRWSRSGVTIFHTGAGQAAGRRRAATC